MFFDKNVGSYFSVHDTFIERPSSSMLIVKRLKS